MGSPPGTDGKATPARPPVERVARGRRRITLGILLAGALFATFALGRQLAAWGDAEPGDGPATARLLLVFWSPYLALAALTLWLGRRAPGAAAILLVTSILMTAWGVYWHLDVLWLRPSVLSQILSPVLIAGNQWLAVLAGGVLAGLAGLVRRREAR